MKTFGKFSAWPCGRECRAFSSGQVVCVYYPSYSRGWSGGLLEVSEASLSNTERPSLKSKQPTNQRKLRTWLSDHLTRRLAQRKDHQDKGMKNLKTSQGSLKRLSPQAQSSRRAEWSAGKAPGALPMWLLPRTTAGFCSLHSGQHSWAVPASTQADSSGLSVTTYCSARSKWQALWDSVVLSLQIYRIHELRGHDFFYPDRLGAQAET